MRCLYLVIGTAAGVASVSNVSAQTPRQATVSVTAALVASELEVKPVALHQLKLVNLADTSLSISFRTGLDGKATQAVTPGRYQLRSIAPIQLEGKSYRWDLAISTTGGQVLKIELTNANAVVDTLRHALQARAVSPEMAVYDQVKAGVVRVEAGLGHGSGFFVDSLGGLIVTNDHVIAGERTLSIALDTNKRVPAQVVARDHDADLALLRVSPLACPQCPRLRLARPDSSGSFVVPGERVIAVGFPLSQRSSVTSGIVSGIRERLVISDVNINPGNSGGPLLNLNGEVVGVNTLIEQASFGPGISGSILVTRLAPLLKHAAETLPTLAPPAFALLPTIGGPAYPLAELRSAAESVPFQVYRKVGSIDANNFSIAFSTPVANIVYAKAYEDEIAKDRRRREARAGLSEDERYSEVATVRDWIDYVGDLTRPAVSIQIIPKQGETFWSAFGRTLVASQGYSPGAARHVFKGDLQDVRWYRNGKPIDPVIGGRTPQRVFVENAWVEMKDVAYRGLYIFAPDMFAPDSNGTPPSIVAHIYDLKHPNDSMWIGLGWKEIPGEVVARVWNDFGPYYRRFFPGRTFVPADPKRFKSRLRELCRTEGCRVRN